MIKLDKDKPIPYFCELKKGCSDAELEEALKHLEIDPTQDDDLRLWFCIQYALPSISMESNTGSERRNLFTYGTLLNCAGKKTILRDYWVPREKWDLISISGGLRKLDRNVGDFGFELIKKHWIPKSKQVAFHSCSASKPYHLSSHIATFAKLQNDYDFDAFVSSYCPVPVCCDEQYPFAFYQGTMWPGPDPSRPQPHVIEFLDYFEYENAIFWLRPVQQNPNAVYGLARSHNFKKTECDLIFVDYKKINPNFSAVVYYNVTLDIFKQHLSPYTRHLTMSLF